MPRRFLPLMFILAAGASACGGKALGSETSGQRIQVATSYNVRTLATTAREAPPIFGGPLLSGSGTFDPMSLKGHVSIVNFWGAWCGECHKEQPLLNRLAARYPSVRFVGIDTRDTHADGRAFVNDEYHVPYTQVFDPFLRVATVFKVSFFPSTYVLDRQGRIAAVIVSAPTSDEEFARLIDAVQAEA